MKPVETSEQKLKSLEVTLMDELNRILDLQYEIAEIREQLDILIKNAAKETYPKGEVVSVERLVAMKEISEVLSIKSAENEKLVIGLHNSIFPDDIFITQNYFGVWVKVGSNTVIKFNDYLNEIEVKVLADLN